MYNVRMKLAFLFNRLTKLLQMHFIRSLNSLKSLKILNQFANKIDMNVNQYGIECNNVLYKIFYFIKNENKTTGI